MSAILKLSRKTIAFGRLLNPDMAAAVVPIAIRNQSSYCHATIPKALPMKKGEPIPGMNFFKDKEPIVAMDRSEYPDWVSGLAKPLPSLAKLRKLKLEEADDRLQMRYLKLRRRMVIKANNRSMEK